MFAAALLILVLVVRSNGYLFLYSTDENGLWKYDDCFFYQLMYGATIKYCLRPYNTSMNTEQYIQCQNNGDKWLFGDLLGQNILPRDISKWSSSVETADDYCSGISQSISSLGM